MIGFFLIIKSRDSSKSCSEKLGSPRIISLLTFWRVTFDGVVENIFDVELLIFRGILFEIKSLLIEGDGHCFHRNMLFRIARKLER